MKINMACGQNILEGWVNVDLHPQHESVLHVDLLDPFPWENGQAEYILCEHILEHMDSAEGYEFLRKCHRLLKPAGVLRVCVPSVTLVRRYQIHEPENYVAYDQFYRQNWSKSPIESLCMDHGHKSVWEMDSLIAVLSDIGFNAYPSVPNWSTSAPLKGVDGHGKVIGMQANQIETVVVEGEKL